MGRGGDSPSKRRINAQRNDRRAQKNERRQARESAEAPPAVDEAEMMARFHQLNERRAAGEVDDEAYEAERHEIFVALGLEDAFQSIKAEEAEEAGRSGESSDDSETAE